MITFLKLFLAIFLLFSGAFGRNAEHDAQQPGCLHVWVNRLNSVDLTSYRRSLLNKMPDLDLRMYKMRAWAIFARPLTGFVPEPSNQAPHACRSSTFKDYRNFVDTRKFYKQSRALESKTQCCQSCHSTTDCFSFTFDTSALQCGLYITKEKLILGNQSETCPSGIGNGHLEMPHYPMWPGHYGHEAGPCLGLEMSSVKHTGHGLELQGIQEGHDQGILDLAKESVVLEDHEYLV